MHSAARIQPIDALFFLLPGIHVLPMVPGQEALMMGVVGHHRQGSDDSAVGGIV